MDDERAIRQLAVRFADAITRGDFSDMPQLWSPDGVWRIMPPGDAHVRGDGARMREVLVERSARWQWFVQMVHDGIVRVDGDRARARWYLTELGRPAGDGEDYFNHGLYVDELVRTADGWRFRSRTYHYLYLDRSPLSGEGWRPPPLT
jgi:ketosteroid isomerase-like protein